MQNLVRSKTIEVTGNAGRGTAGAGPGRDLLYGSRADPTSGPRNGRRSGTSSSSSPPGASTSSHTTDYPTPHPLHRRCRWPNPSRTTRTHPPPEECNWDPPTATTEHMPHRLTKRQVPHDYHATSNSRGRRTLPLQWASPEGTFTWGEILPGTVPLTYMWLQDTEAHTQAPGAHLLLTLEGEAAIENVHTAEGEDYVRANADTAVWLHAHEYTRPPTMVPGSHPWHVIIVHLPTGTDTGDAQQGWADRWAHVCASLHDGLHRPSLTSHTLEPASTTAESHTGAAPPHRGLGLHAHPPRRSSERPQNRHLQPPGPRAHPPR